MPPVFSWRSFGLSALTVIGAPIAAALGHVFLSDRLGLPAGTASGLAIGAGVAWAILGGAAAAVAGRRIAFYEIVAATLLLLALALGPLVFVLPALRGLPLVLHTWQYQGKVVLTAGLLLACLSAGALAFLGSTLAFLLTGSGRFDPSLGWELFVARSHLRLHARTLGALFLIVVTGVIPGLLAGIAWSAWQDRKARRAAMAGEPHERPRLARHHAHDPHLHRRRRHRGLGAHRGALGDERLRAGPQVEDPRGPRPRRGPQVRAERLHRLARDRRTGCSRFPAWPRPPRSSTPR